MKKQFNYKSLNTLGDVDITQSVVPGGGEAEVKDTMEYVVFNMETDLATYGGVLGIFAYLVKFPTKIEIRSLINDDDVWIENAIAFAIDTGAVVDFDGLRESIKDHALSIGVDLSLLPHITKEEFYKLPAALKIYTYYEDAIAHKDEMKTSFDALWAIWERNGVEGQFLAITIPNADIASITEINRDGDIFVFNLTSILGSINTYEDRIVTQMQFDETSKMLRKTEIFDTGEIIYEYEELS